MIAAGFFFLTGCSSEPEHKYEPIPGGDNDMDRDVISGEADADIITDHDTEVITGGDADVIDSVIISDADVEEIGPETPYAPGRSKYSEAPCAFPASLSYDPNSDRLFTTCGGNPNAIFRSTPMSDEGDVAWEEAGYAEGFPSNHLTLSDDLNLITHSDPHGFTIVDSSTGATAAGVDFSILPLVDDLGFAPNNPAGAAFVGGWIYIATSNIDVADYMNPALTTYHTGTVIACPYDLTDGLDELACTPYETSVKNPTGMMVLNEGSELAVLSSNTYDLSTGSNASLTVFDLATMAGTSYPLGNVTAQISPKIAMTSGGLMLIGVQQPTNSIIMIDPVSGIVDDRVELPMITNFISAIEAFGDTAIISDFGIFGEHGQVIFSDTRPDGWEGQPTTELSGSAGPSVVIGNELYQVVTAPDGMSASIWTLNVEGM
jgi:hypothetical protein